VKNGVMKTEEIFQKHCLNVGWRIVKNWIESQTALIEIEMAQIAEVFMPYLVINDRGETLSQKILTGGGLKLLSQ
jgi:hypothetical protein